MKALVNGKEMNLMVQKSYHNGIETVYECINDQGVWVAVSESTIIKEKLNVSTSFQYEGDYEGEQRTVWVTLTGKTEESVETAYSILEDICTLSGYNMGRCSNVEVNNKGKFYITEAIHVESAKDAKYFKQCEYAELKKRI